MSSFSRFLAVVFAVFLCSSPAFAQVSEASLTGLVTDDSQAVLIDALIAQGAANLTVVCNNAGNGETGLAALLKAGQVLTSDLRFSSVIQRLVTEVVQLLTLKLCVAPRLMRNS